jgi:hypothetical protein
VNEDGPDRSGLGGPISHGSMVYGIRLQRERLKAVNALDAVNALNAVNVQTLNALNAVNVQTVNALNAVNGFRYTAQGRRDPRHRQRDRVHNAGGAQAPRP